MTGDGMPGIRLGDCKTSHVTVMQRTFTKGKGFHCPLMHVVLKVKLWIRKRKISMEYTKKRKTSN